jgi:CubicO group peptidase (beta-lactamase class C family)
MNNKPVGYKIKAFEARNLVIFVLVIVLLLPACTKQPGSSTIDPDRIAQLDEILNRMAADETFSGSVLIAQNGEVLFRRGYGSANRELGISNTPRTRFRVGSITKQFTAMAILILQSQGRLDVLDPICKYIEDCPAAWEDITIHHLLTHTSGITPMVGYSGSLPITPAELIALFKDSPLDFQPGERFSYSNCAYWVLGYIIEQASGQSYEDFIQKAIFKPLNMHDSGFDQDARGLAVGYKNQYTISVPSGGSDSSFVYSAGAIYSTVEDLLHWDQALYTDQLIPQDLINQMFAPQIIMYPDLAGSMAYGYGWFIQGDLGRQMVWHGGAIEGFRSVILRYPDERITIIILSNQEDSSETMYFIFRSLIHGMISIETEDGSTITYAGPQEAQAGGELLATFMVTDPSEHPGKGLLVGTLDEPPKDTTAIRTSGLLSTDGMLTLFLPVDNPAGPSSLYCIFKGVEYKITNITISP